VLNLQPSALRAPTLPVGHYSAHMVSLYVGITHGVGSFVTNRNRQCMTFAVPVVGTILNFALTTLGISCHPYHLLLVTIPSSVYNTIIVQMVVKVGKDVEMTTSILYLQLVSIKRRPKGQIKS
jgi:hypothetical protein